MSALLPFDAFAAQALAALDIAPSAPVHGHSGLFDDLGLDSMQALQLMFVVEAMAGCDVPPPELPAIFTLGDAYDYFVYLLAPAG